MCGREGAKWLLDDAAEFAGVRPEPAVGGEEEWIGVAGQLAFELLHGLGRRSYPAAPCLASSASPAARGLWSACRDSPAPRPWSSPVPWPGTILVVSFARRSSVRCASCMPPIQPPVGQSSIGKPAGLHRVARHQNVRLREVHVDIAVGVGHRHQTVFDRLAAERRLAGRCRTSRSAGLPSRAAGRLSSPNRG